MDPAIARVLASNHAAAGVFLRHAGDHGFGAFFGPRNAAARAAVLSALWGKPVSKSRAPWGVFVREVRAVFGAEGDCDAARERDCEAKIRGAYANGGVTGIPG